MLDEVHAAILSKGVAGKLVGEEDDLGHLDTICNIVLELLCKSWIICKICLIALSG
jgi:hypothetical protein